MKLTLRSTGPAELEDSDLGAALRYRASKNKKTNAELTRTITDYLVEVKGMKVLRIQKSTDLTQIVAEVEFSVNQGAKMFGSKVKDTPDRASNEGFSKTYKGFYKSVREILDEQKAKKKDYIGFDDLYEQLINETDAKGVKKFVRNGVPIEMSRFKQYLSASQLDPKRNQMMKGVKHDKTGEGLNLKDL